MNDVALGPEAREDVGLMKTATQIFELLTLVSYVGLGVLALIRWRRLRSDAALWLAATFGVLGAVALIGRFIPEDVETATVRWEQKLLIAVLVLFPYFLFRFHSTLIPVGKMHWLAANVLTGAAVIGALALENLPEAGEPRSSAFQIYAYLLLVQWVYLSGLVAVRLWRRGKGQPGVARARMRTMSLGAIGLGAAIAVAVLAQSEEESGPVQLATQLLGFVSGPLFLLGFAPPAPIRALWRRAEMREMHESESALMEAQLPSQIIAILLTRSMDVLGGQGAVLIGPSGDVIEAKGVSTEQAGEIARGTDAAAEGKLRTPTVSQPVGDMTLVVLTSTTTPYFGSEELELLRRFASLAALALGRAQQVEREREIQRQLVEAQEIARIGSWDWDLERNVLIWSDEMYRIYGVDRRSFRVTQENVQAMVHPNDREHGRRVVERSRATGEAFAFEHWIVRPDGEERVLQSRGRVLLNRGGEAVRMFGTEQDVTARKEQERALTEKAHLLDLAHDAIFVRSLEGEIRYWNEGAERLYGWTSAEALGRTTVDLLRTHFPGSHEEHVKAVLEKGSWEGELIHRTRDDQPLVVSSRWAVQYDDEGAPQAILEINTDITQRKRAEELREQFIANAAHELRTPLTTMVGFAETLDRHMDRMGEKEVRSAISAMNRSGDRLAVLVNNLLDLTKVQRGDVDIRLETLDLHALVDDVVRAAPPPSEVSLDVDVDREQVQGDPDRLHQVLINLLTNAYRYGGSKVSVSATADNAHVSLFVTDDGPGVEESLVPTLFEPFVRGSSSGSVGGSGLGLAIVRGLVEAQGGTVGYQQAEPSGATFRITLRRAD